MRPIYCVVLMTACGSVDMTVDGTATQTPVFSDDVDAPEEVIEEAPDVASHADSDNDNLCDAEEMELGSNPFDDDSDGDSYRDGDEVLAGSDLLDPDSVIYKGGWPYNANKDHIVGAAAGFPQVGGVFGRYELEDQFGDVVDFYDFLGGESYTWVQVIGSWCEPCQQMAATLSSDELGPLDTDFPSMRGLIESGQVKVLTVIAAGENGPATMDDVQAWAQAWPIKNVAVLGDVDGDVWNGTESRMYPSSWLLAPDGTVVAVGEGAPVVAIWMEENLGPVAP